MNAIVNCSRRGFLKSSVLAGGGLILGVHLPGLRNSIPALELSSPVALNAFVRIAADETVTVVVNHSELGQGPYTSIPMLVAEELDADWSKVRYEPAPVDPAYNHTVFGMQITGGSTSTWTEWERVRKAGAAARQMLIAAAADTWKIDPASCRTENGFVVSPTAQRASYGSLVEKASKLDAPQNVTVKNPKDFKLVGKPTKRLDTPDKTNGKAVFGIDVNAPGMLVAVVDQRNGRVHLRNAIDRHTRLHRLQPEGRPPKSAVAIGDRCDGGTERNCRVERIHRPHRAGRIRGNPPARFGLHPGGQVSVGPTGEKGRCALHHRSSLASSRI